MHDENLGLLQGLGGNPANNSITIEMVANGFVTTDCVGTKNIFKSLDEVFEFLTKRYPRLQRGL